MNILNRREAHTLGTTLGGSLAPALAPLGLMRQLLRWDPLRDLGPELEVRSAFCPSFDIRETADAYVFEADLPGLKDGDLDINLTGNRLTISGKRETPGSRETGNYFAMERSYGSFARSFNLPDGVDGDHIQANLADGVLTLSLAKVPEVQPKKITVGMAGRAGH
jgi:HSP20 family protein